MSCSSATDAPWNDLMLFHSLLRYADAHLQISKSAITAFKRHLWYLTEEMVHLALSTCRATCFSWQSSGYKTSYILCSQASTSIWHRVRETKVSRITFYHSHTCWSCGCWFIWFIFNSLQLDTHFLTEDVANWPNSASYQAATINVQALNGVNDSA